MGIIRTFIIIYAGTGATSAVLLVILWLIKHRFFTRSPKTFGTKVKSYDVFHRTGTRRIAVCKQSKFNWLMGLAYSGLLFISMPLIIWRYGKYPSLYLFVAPVGISFAISFLVFEDVSAIKPLLTIFFAFGGLYIVANDLEYYKKALVTRGWKMIGSCEATSEKKATELFQHAPRMSDPENTFNRKYGRKYGTN